MDISGRRLLHYEVLEKIGEGGMGVVYKARDTHLDRYVVLKVLPAGRIADPDRKRRFVQDAKAASALHHSNIVNIHDIASDGVIDFIVMEYLKGRTLASLILEGLSALQVLRYAIPMADALAKAHGAGIIHRDLKPSNVMVDEDGQVKLLDFGLAKLGASPDSRETDATRSLRSDETAAGALVGTVAYMSPEQAEGRPLDARSDLFSLGAVFYEMLTGKRAFGRASAASTLAAIIRDHPKPVRTLVRDVPSELELVVQRCLHKDRNQRYPSAAALLAALEECRTDVSSVASSAVNLKLLGRQVRRPAFLLPTLLLAAVASIFGARGYQRHTERRWVEKFLPGSVMLTSYWPALSREITLETTPDGAEVFRKDYDKPAAPWERVGRSPLRIIRVPRDTTRWRIEKPGYLTVEGSFMNAVTWASRNSATAESRPARECTLTGVAGWGNPATTHS